jgi:hypothetical protein
MFRLMVSLTALLGFCSSVLAQVKGNALPPGAIARLGEVRYRNVGRVFSVAFSPDSKTLAAGAWDGSVRLWEPATGREIRQFVGHAGWVRAVAFSPDGKTLASGGKDRIIRLWETATGKELRRMGGHQNWIQHLAFSHDGKMLASWGTGQTLRLWDVVIGKALRRIALPQWVSASLAFSPDGKLLAYPGDRDSIVLLDIATGKEARRITRPQSWFTNLVFSSDGKILASLSYDHKIHLWDPTSGQELRSMVDREDDVYGIVFAPDGRSAVSAGDRTIRVWEVKTRLERGRFRSPDRQPSSLAFAPDGRTIAQGSDDTTVLLWDVTGHLNRGRLRPARLPPKELQTLWGDLAGDDATVAYRAIWTLVAAPEQSVPFIQEHLRPVAAVDDLSIGRLVADLDSEHFQTRKKATERLEKLGDLAEPVLRKALQPKAPLETRQRIERLLELVAAERENPSPNGLRVLRAVESLERMDTPGARQALEQYAQGEPAAELTKQAKAALERLTRR